MSLKIEELTIYEDGKEPAAATAQAPLIDVLAELGDDLPADFPKNAKHSTEGSFILTLAYPVRYRLRQADGSITEQVTRDVRLQRLKGKHMAEIRNAEKDDVTVQMIASSARLDFGKAQMLLDEMDQADITAALRVIGFFIAPGRPTGP